MRLRFSLQWKVLILVAGTTSVILLVSAYLHGLITQGLVEEDRYNTAVRQVVSIAKRTVEYGQFAAPSELVQEFQVVVNSQPNFSQIDVYEQTPQGLQLVATTSPDAERLPTLNGSTQDNELGEIERPLAGVVTDEVERDGHRYWVITAAITGRNRSGYVSALVHKASRTHLVSRLQFQHNLVLAGAAVTSVALLHLLFAVFFRRPVRDIVDAMSHARTGDLAAHATVHSDDEMGTIARGFNEMIGEMRVRHQEREQLLLQVNNFNEELREEIAQATRELRAANEALLETQQSLANSERLAAVGQLAASLAHQIGTPLNVISGHLRLLARDHPGDKETQRRVEIVNAQLEFIVKTVKRLLARTHRERPPLCPLDLNALVSELLWLVKPTLDAHGIAVDATLASALPPVRGDRDSLLQLFLNLVNNSIEAMPQGGTLQIASQLDRGGRTIELVFRDTGPGIDPSVRDHLFDPLWTTKPGGSGFGLAVGREIMIEHGGQIEAMSEPPDGATFRLTLPADRASRAPKETHVA